MTSREERIKHIYASHHDRIREKRLESPFWLRRYTHRTIHERFVRHARPGALVLDAGCGEGALTERLAARGAEVIGVDISHSNLRAAQLHRAPGGQHFVVADLEALPIMDRAVDLVVSSHTLEHAPQPVRAARELSRVARAQVVVAMPTCLSPAGWALLGGDVYWKLTRRSIYAIPLGLLRTAAAKLRQSDGPNEGYAGSDELPHVWRFPSSLIALLRAAGLFIEEVEAGPLVVPYLSEYVRPFRRIQVWLDRLRLRRVIRWLGFGTHVTARRCDTE